MFGLHLIPFFGPWGQERLLSSECLTLKAGGFGSCKDPRDSFSDLHVLEYAWLLVPLPFLCEGS